MQEAHSKDIATSVDVSVTAPFGEWYLRLPSAHRDPTVIEAYAELQVETDHLYTIITRDELPRATRVVFTRCRQPYETDQELICAVRERNSRDHNSRGC